jgi:hypothetical protein
MVKIKHPSVLRVGRIWNNQTPRLLMEVRVSSWLRKPHQSLLDLNPLPGCQAIALLVGIYATEMSADIHMTGALVHS